MLHPLCFLFFFFNVLLAGRFKEGCICSAAVPKTLICNRFLGDQKHLQQRRQQQQPPEHLASFTFWLPDQPLRCVLEFTALTGSHQGSSLLGGTGLCRSESHS